MKYLLDTNTCVFFIRGRFNLDKVIKEKGWDNCFISEITVAELRYGAENSDNPRKSHKTVDEFIDALKIIPIFSSIRLYAKEKVRLRRLGKPINDEFDMLIGVTAVSNKLTLVTDNTKDFQNLEGIKMENWIVKKAKL
jgi:tRNA(fMet)-specific endonuclease VapC